MARVYADDFTGVIYSEGLKSKVMSYAKQSYEHDMKIYKAYDYGKPNLNEIIEHLTKIVNKSINIYIRDDKKYIKWVVSLA